MGRPGVVTLAAVTLAAVALALPVGCGYLGEAGSTLDGGALEGGRLLGDGAPDPRFLPDGAPDPAFVLDGGLDGPLPEASVDAGDGGPPICQGAAYCSSKNVCIAGGKNCGDDVECTLQTTTCWTCGAGGLGKARRICQSTACAATSGCKCTTSAQCPNDELCANGSCVRCGMTHLSVACGKDTCLACTGGGFACAASPDNNCP